MLMTLMKKQENLNKSKEIFASIDFRQAGKVSLEELKADYCYDSIFP